MRISAVPSIATPVISPDGVQAPSHVENIRAMKMRVNQTPLSLAQEPPISDTSSQVPASVEATQPLSPQLALLAKQRRALQVKERELRDRERAMQSQPGTAVDLARLKSEPLSVLLENGVTYDQLTEAILAGQQNSEVHSLKAEIAALKDGIDQKFTERDSLAEKQVLAEMRREADQLIQGETYELVRETGNVQTAIDLIHQRYKKTGEVMPVSKALQLIEEELFADAQKIIKLRKMQSQMGAPQRPMQAPAQWPAPAMRTLTNRDTASVPMSAKQRAMAAFYGQLKR